MQQSGEQVSRGEDLDQAENLAPMPVPAVQLHAGPDLPLLGLGVCLLVLLMLTLPFCRGRWPLLLPIALLLLAADLRWWSWAGSPRPVPDQTQAPVIAAALLNNCYRAFAAEEPAATYDALAPYAAEACLVELYLDIRRVLERQQGRLLIRDCRLLDAELELVDGIYVGTLRWFVLLRIEHEDHSHERDIVYRAVVRIAPVDGRWRFLHIELLDAAHQELSVLPTRQLPGTSGDRISVAVSTRRRLSGLPRQQRLAAFDGGIPPCACFQQRGFTPTGRATCGRTGPGPAAPAFANLPGG